MLIRYFILIDDFMSKLVNLCKRIVSGIWALFTLTRSVVLNSIFILLFVGFLIAIFSDAEKVIVPNKSALILNLQGDLVEQKREVNPMDALLMEAFDEKEDNPEVLLANLLDVIAKAQNDDRVQLLVLQLSGLKSAGLSKLQDVGAALIKFKTSGKKIIALGDGFSQDQYYLASHADDIWMNPQGFMLLDGYSRHSLYFKSALEKLSINSHIFRVGTFKSAVEPFIRDDMSDEAKQANTLWLNDLWQQYKVDVAKQRGFSVSNFDDKIENLLTKFTNANNSFADYALDNNWVDQLKTRNQMRNDLISLVGKNKKGDSYNHIGYKNYLAATSSMQIGESNLNNKVAVIIAKGPILNGTQKPGTIGGDSTAKLLRQARTDDKVKAVVLRVDSPGGSAFASEIIRQEVERLKAAGKPVVASMGTYAASGGYWISASADQIIASPSTITGSIGIFGMIMTFEDSLSKLGIHTDGVGTTDISGFSPTRPLTKGMSQLFQLSINKGYQDFISLVATNRNMTLSQVDAVAQGRVWSGKKAKELGLVDELGNLSDAIASAANLAQLDQYDTLIIKKQPSTHNLLLKKMMGEAYSFANAAFGTTHNVTEDNLSSMASVTNKPMTQFINLLQTEVSKMNQFNDPQGMYTLCLVCNVQ